jgi:hypothetical protein
MNGIAFSNGFAKTIKAQHLDAATRLPASQGACHAA